MQTYPACSFKGSDTRLILGFVIAVVERGVVDVEDDIAGLAFSAAKSMDNFLRLVFGLKADSGCRKAVLDKTEGSRALNFLTAYLEKFYAAARSCFDQRLCFFKLTPKFHYLMHVALDLEKQLNHQGAVNVLSPGLFATQMAEDATGRSCRISRTCHVRTTSLRVAQKWLIATKLFWNESAG